MGPPQLQPLQRSLRRPLGQGSTRQASRCCQR